MKEVDSNKQAWSKVSQDHYNAYKKKLLAGTHRFNPYIEKELGDIGGKSVIHLQCNTGADTILLAKKAKHATGVDLVPDNILYAKKLAGDCGVKNIDFIEADIMKLKKEHSKTYDVVFVSEGALGWLPDIQEWGQTVRHLLKEDGFLYVLDSHPFFLMLDADKLADEIFDVHYPYFSKVPDVEDSIGGYASEAKKGVQAYFWNYTVADLIGSLTSAGMHVEYFHEFEENFYNAGGMQTSDGLLFNHRFNKGRFPMSFSLRACVYRA